MVIDFYGGTNPVLRFTVQGLRDKEDVLVEVKHLVHGGRSGRTKEANVRHVGDLESYGVKHEFPPVSAVAFLLPTFNATTSQSIAMYDNANNAEVEYVLIADNYGNILVSVGSDHTDRDLEKTGGPPKSKLLAPKVMAANVWRYNDVKDHWDEIIMRSYAYCGGGPELYQEEKLGTILPPDVLMANTEKQTGIGDLKSCILFGGTIPSLKGEFVFGKGWDLELFDPVLKRGLKHHYDVQVIWHRVPPYPTAERPPAF